MVPFQYKINHGDTEGTEVLFFCWIGRPAVAQAMAGQATIQQKTEALRAGNKIVSGITCLPAYSQYKVRHAIAAKRLGAFRRASSPARGKIDFLRELCASSEAPLTRDFRYAPTRGESMKSTNRSY